MDFKKLAEPFAPSDIEWRVQSAKSDGKPWARVLAYITNRAIMERLDEIATPAKWKNEFKTGPDGGVLCGISILIGNEWITKWDGAANTNIDKVKGGLSSAMKRAAVQWGIGRYLYKIEAGYANIHDKGQYSAQYKNKTWFKYDPPKMPPWAIPENCENTPKGAPSREVQDIDNVQETPEEYHERVQNSIIECLTTDDLTLLWNSSSRDEKKEFGPSFTARKTAILEGGQ